VLLSTAASVAVAAPQAPRSGAEVRADDTAEPTTDVITLAQANLNKDQSTAKFEADAAKVFAEQPDFITFNEVQRREDTALAPPGYAMFRTPGPRTGWAPVVWDATKWTAINTGTWQVSDNPPGRHGLVGVRFANWATLADTDGRVVSVISVHIAPNSKQTAMLLVSSLKRLRALADQLLPSGPVIIGGDFNMGYRSSRYQPEYLEAAGLRSTYDLTGQAFPTHRRGGIIDYFFLGPEPSFSVVDQYPVQLGSDHRMLIVHADLSTVPSGDTQEVFSPGTVTARSDGSRLQRRAIRNLEVRAIAATPSGAAIHVASDLIQGRGLFQALLDATTRGVHVTVITSHRKLEPEEATLRSVLGTDTRRPTYLTKVSTRWRYVAGGSSQPGRGGLDPTMLLISQAGATNAFALVSRDTNLGRVPHKPGTVTTATVTTDLAKYDKLYHRYLAPLGVSY
jgi:endonuclease/exonuclease/phosphatase (EEP) superfamily protein YafD